MEVLIKAAQLILSLSILVIIHEFGHFMFAKLFGARVEKFYLFFNPWFSLFKFKRGETEYGVGWVPLGGYVKISGMIDESMDKEQMKQPPRPHEFRSKPAWQRLLIMVGGVMMNFLLAIGIYIGVLMAWGESYLPPENAQYGIVCDSVALEAGLQNGDVILKLDQTQPESFTDIIPHILLNDVQTITVKRNGEVKDIRLPDDAIKKIIKEQQFFSLGIPFIIDDFSDNSPAQAAGLQAGDQIVGINGQSLELFQEYPPVLAQNKGQEVNLTVKRNGSTRQLPVSVDEQGRIGVYVKNQPSELFEMKTHEYGFFAAIPAGFQKGYDEVSKYLKQFKLIFQPETEAYKSVGGFIAIGNIFPAYWDWQAFWLMTALLSIMLGVINILPIPALDGGHVMFLLYEIIARRKPSERFMEVAQIAGMLILLSLIVYANGNDIIKLFQ